MLSIDNEATVTVTTKVLLQVLDFLMQNAAPLRWFPVQSERTQLSSTRCEITILRRSYKSAGCETYSGSENINLVASVSDLGTTDCSI